MTIVWLRDTYLLQPGQACYVLGMLSPKFDSALANRTATITLPFHHAARKTPMFLTAIGLPTGCKTSRRERTYFPVLLRYVAI